MLLPAGSLGITIIHCYSHSQPIEFGANRRWTGYQWPSQILNELIALADDLLTVHWGKALTPENCLQSAKCLDYPIHFKHISFDCILYILHIYIYILHIYIYYIYIYIYYTYIYILHTHTYIYIYYTHIYICSVRYILNFYIHRKLIFNSPIISPSNTPTATLFGVLPRLGLVEVGLFLCVHGISARAQR